MDWVCLCFLKSLERLNKQVGQNIGGQSENDTDGSISLRPGYRYQRRYLEKKYRGPTTSHQLWDVSSLATSKYPVGTQITDHFEVVHHDPEHIVVRCGDSPLKTGVRSSDGLFEMSAKVHKEAGNVEFGLKSVFFQGEGKSDKPPMDGIMEWAHKQYTKV